MGAAYIKDPESWDHWCEKIRTKFDFYYVKCRSVQYNDRKAFFVIDIVEKGDEFRLSFRLPPIQTVTLVNDEIINEWNTLRTRMWELFYQGSGAIEDGSQGYLNYSDSEMAKSVGKLVQLVPPYRINLLEVITLDKNAEKRARAANLLNWALDVEESINAIYPFMNDPDRGVRNNLSRFMLHYLDRLTDRTLRINIIDSFSKQLWWPDHADRNKAIIGLYDIASYYPDEKDYIKQVAFEGIETLAHQSILPNVGDIARQLAGAIND